MTTTATKLARIESIAPAATVQVHLFQQSNVEYIKCDLPTLYEFLAKDGRRFEVRLTHTQSL